MRLPSSEPLLQNRLDIHDRKQFEIKLEYQPSRTDPTSKYLVETWLFLPSSLNVDAETYPRQDFYADLHNYIRLKTPVLTLEEITTASHSPLVKLEKRVIGPPVGREEDVVYNAKLLSCVFRGALRRFEQQVDDRCNLLENVPGCTSETIESPIRESMKRVREILTRFRGLVPQLAEGFDLQEKTKASLRLVDEYLSLSLEQFFRKTVTDMDALPRSGTFIELRKEMMAEVINEETYRKQSKLRSVISPTGDNEEYMHRIGFLKKFCMNILFLSARREERRRNWEEVLFAMAAGIAMAFATVVALWAQTRFPQVSLNFFLIVVVGYMMKDRIKEGLRRIFSTVALKHLYDRATAIVDPVTKHRLGLLREKVDYFPPTNVPDDVKKLRATDDFVTVSQGELSESVIRYQKQIALNSELLPRADDGVTGVTDIVRLNVDRLLRDMDDPEYALEYVDLEDFSVGRIKAAKSYQVDLVFRFTVDDGDNKKMNLQLVRLVLDRNGIKRMVRFEQKPENVPPPVRSVA
ncbi:MAG: hypothetical protein ACJ790_14410 [Myxococcaceae bacterium]